LFQIIEEIREMIGFLVEPQVQLNEWNSWRDKAVQIVGVLQQQSNLFVDVIALWIFHVLEVWCQLTFDASELFVLDLKQYKFQLWMNFINF
jgi:hypothetical protein